MVGTIRTIPFTKMEGLGNDFVVIDGREVDVTGANLTDLATTLCDRHFGVGADGLIIVGKGTHANYAMRVFNPDGTEPEQCGNGLRCFAKYVYENDSDKKDIFSVETKGGTVLPAVFTKDGHVMSVEVDMGEPRFKPEEIPVTIHGKDKIVNEPLRVQDVEYKMTCISMGNPHCVIVVPDLEKIDIGEIGPLIENDPLFPEKVNVHFAKVRNPKEIEMHSWERGAGETLACGTGACATLVATNLLGLTERKAVLHLPGGELLIEWSTEDNHVTMTGPAKTVFRGEYSLL